MFRPIIERLGDDIPLKYVPDQNRKIVAGIICQYLSNRDEYYLPVYYKAIEYLLNSSESERILLYLPFDELARAPEHFKQAYMRVWWRLINVRDVSENFHEGDVYEIDARPDGKLTRVVKCVHLIPWLLKAGYIDKSQLPAIFSRGCHDDLAVQSFKDILGYLADHSLITKDELINYEADLYGVPFRRVYSPLYISEKRRKWLEEKDKTPSKFVTPYAKLEGPFSPNLLPEDIKKVTSTIDPKDILLVGGSRLKGYGTEDSDFDTWRLADLAVHEDLYPGSPEGAHLYFNTAWVTGAEVGDIDTTINEILWVYDDPKTRKQSLEKLESDLLQYRLLHKGFARFHNMQIFETNPYIRMDGDCPFYEDSYRRVATMLFAKYVFIPHVR